jgi:hypothetical protein
MLLISDGEYPSSGSNDDEKWCRTPASPDAGGGGCPCSCSSVLRAHCMNRLESSMLPMEIDETKKSETPTHRSFKSEYI